MKPLALMLLCFINLTVPGRAAVTGEVGGDTISAEVDSAIAQYFLENYLKGRRTNSQFDLQIDSILKSVKSGRITDEGLKAISDRTSLDFAAMVFAHVQTQRNFGVKKAFLGDYELVKRGAINLRSAARRYKIVLVPGLFYKSKPETKGDLREVRSTLEEAGFEVDSIPILNAGTVEQNAHIIAEYIKAQSDKGKEIILISTSKGGPDAHYALGHLLEPKDAKKISVWFSVGGALRGSYLADPWMTWPRCWLASTIGTFVGFSIDMVASLSVANSMKRMEQIQVPSNIAVVNFVGVPLSGTLINEVRDGYKQLKAYGPNDGITLLPDEIVEGSTVITALGLDHWYRDPDLKRKILALVSTVTSRKNGVLRSSPERAAGV